MTSFISALVVSAVLSTNYPITPHVPMEGLPGEGPTLPNATVIDKRKLKNYF